MQVSIRQRMTFLRSLAVFRELAEAPLRQLAEQLGETLVEAGQTLFAAGDRAENLYILYQGAVDSWLPPQNGNTITTSLEKGDVFGEVPLLIGGRRRSSVAAREDCLLLYLSKRDFRQLLSDHPEVREKFEHFSSGEALKDEMRFDWLREGESLHHVARKHSAYLWFRLARAIGLAILAFISFYIAIAALPANQSLWVSAGVGLLLIAGVVAAWQFLDWRNDYYILTNLRVVWLEQVLLRSASRKEAPLASIQSVNIHTTLLGRWLDFGDVVVRTYTGTVLMPAVAEPLHVKHLIEEYVERLRKQVRDEKHDSIRQAVRQSLGRPTDTGDTPLSAPALETVDLQPRFQLFKTRQVEGDRVTYHKHWFVLFSSLLLPAFFFVAILYGVQAIYGGLPDSPTAWLIALFFAGLPLAVLVYRYFDWQNDIYRVTKDSLIDSEKKPLGSEVTKSASLSNVLSLENHRVGLLGLLLNFGVVRINVGDSSLDFVDVHNPALIQQDIFLRMEALKGRQAEVKAEEERQRMAEWLKVYEEERQGDR